MLNNVANLYNIKKNVNATSSDPAKHNTSYYCKCVIGGLLACGSTHSGITPLDLVKCNIQANPGKYKGIIDGFKQIQRTKGFGTKGGLYLGFVPTLYGYSIQGMGKFGCYELFKDMYASIAGEKLAHKYRTTLYLVASASAEFLADIGLCPFESVKVRMQTSPPEANFPTSFNVAWRQIMDSEGWSGFYKGLSPLWLRQIPYTMMKFACFERTVEAFYKYFLTAKPKKEYNMVTQLSVTFASGYIAGIFCAIVSHPADTVVSKLNKTPGGTIGGVLKECGWMGVWKGLGPRIIMIGTLTAFQWWIYDSFKTAMGMGTTGGH